VIITGIHAIVTLAIHFIAHPGKASISGVAVNVNKAALGYSANVGAAVDRALVAVVAFDLLHPAAQLCIADIWLADIARVLADDRGVLANGFVALHGTCVVGTGIGIIAYHRRYFASFGNWIAHLGIAGVSVGAGIAIANNTKWSYGGRTAGARGKNTSFGSAWISVVAFLVGVFASIDTITSGNIARINRIAGYVYVRAHSVQARVLSAGIIIVAVHGGVFAAAVSTIARYWVALVHCCAVDGRATLFAGGTIRSPNVCASRCRVAVIISARVIVIAVLGDK
jgi:hypothetical protein